jgi:hypothetical protein
LGGLLLRVRTAQAAAEPEEPVGEPAPCSSFSVGKRPAAATDLA